MNVAAADDDWHGVLLDVSKFHYIYLLRTRRVGRW